MKPREKLIKFGMLDEFNLWKEDFQTELHIGDKVKFVKRFTSPSHVCHNKIPAGRVGIIQDINPHKRIDVMLSARVPELDSWENVLHITDSITGSPESFVRRIK